MPNSGQIIKRFGVYEYKERSETKLVFCYILGTKIRIFLYFVAMECPGSLKSEVLAVFLVYAFFAKFFFVAFRSLVSFSYQSAEKEAGETTLFDRNAWLELENELENLNF